MPYPSGDIAVVNARMQDISGGMQWNMRDAYDIRFLAVNGTVTVGSGQAKYDFTLVEYHLYIDEVSWILFSTLNDALGLEFAAEFWDTVNKNRKERWGFLEVPWIADRQAYDVAAPYLDVRMSIFDNEAHTVRVVSPFIYRDTYLRVHPNGAAIFAEDKRLAYLLPLIVEAHKLLPPAPLFWVQDDKTIPLHRQTLWLHASTIQWLSDTGEAYPPELRDEIQPRLDKLKPPARPMQPPQPPKPTRWRELHKEKSNTQASQASASQDPQASQPVPQQLAETEKRYMELQAVMATLGQRTLAESRLKANQPDQKPDGTTDSPAPKQADTGLDTQDSSQPPPTKLSAQTLTASRPTPPPPPPSKEPRKDAPGTGELSDPGHRHPGAKKLPQPGKEQPLIVEVNAGPPPILSPTDSPDTLTSETVVVSSPAPDQEENFDAMDMATLQSRRLAALETVQDLTAQLFRAQDAVSRITKRLKTMQESQATPMPPAHPREDIEIEGMD
jgi:molecular chaperone GrpE (heat shock protein)